MGRLCHLQYVTGEKKDQKYRKPDQLFPVHSKVTLGLLLVRFRYKLFPINNNKIVKFLGWNLKMHNNGSLITLFPCSITFIFHSTDTFLGCFTKYVICISSFLSMFLLICFILFLQYNLQSCVVITTLTLEHFHQPQKKHHAL